MITMLAAALAFASMQASRPPAVVGYLPDYRAGSIAQIEFARLTDVVYFSAEPTAVGGLDTTRIDPRVLPSLMAQAGEAGAEVHLAVGGWGRSAGFAPMASSPATRQAFLENVRDYILAHGFQGLDFDWEFPANQQERENYSALLGEAGQLLRPLGLSVSVAVPGTWVPFDTHPTRLVDRIHVMSYDNGTPHATFDQMRIDAAFWRSLGWADHQIIVGVPFYGRRADNAAATYAGLLAIEDPGPDVDEIDGYHFNNRTTMARKARWTFEQGLGGVMIWEIGQDSFDGRSLLRVIAREAKQSRASTIEPKP